MGRKSRLTRLEGRSELLTNSHHQDFLPELLTLGLLYTEGPRSAVDVTGVFPHRLDTALEEVDRVLHLEGVDGKIVQDAPEGFQSDNVFFDDGEALIVRKLLAVLVMEDVPGTFERRWAHASKHSQLPIFAYRGCLNGRSSAGVLSDRGETIDVQGWVWRHCLFFGSVFTLSDSFGKVKSHSFCTLGESALEAGFNVSLVRYADAIELVGDCQMLDDFVDVFGKRGFVSFWK